MFINQNHVVSRVLNTNFVDEPDTVPRHGTGRSLLWSTDENPLFDTE